MRIFLSFTWNSVTLSEQFRMLGRRLQEQGYEVIALIQPGREPKEPHAFTAIYHWRSERGTQWRDAVFFAQLIRKYRPICVIGNFSTVTLNLLVGWLGRVPCRVAWYHSLSSQFPGKAQPIKSAFLKWRMKMVFLLATHIVAVSEATREDLISTYDVPRLKTLVLYNGASEVSVGEESVPTPQPNLLLNVATLQYYKAQDTLIRAVSLLVSDFPDIVVEFLGEGNRMENYKQLAQQLGVAQHCVFRGVVSPKQVAASFRRAFISVLPSRSDSFPVALLEAMAHGVPTVASRVGGIPEAIADGVNGLLVPPDDPVALADRLRRLLADIPLRDALALGARKCFEERFSLSVISQQQAEAIHGLINQAANAQ